MKGRFLASDIGKMFKVRDDLLADTHYDGLWFDEDMNKFIGKEFIIEKLNTSGYSRIGDGYVVNKAMCKEVSTDFITF